MFPLTWTLFQVAISSLMRIFRDPSLSSYHQKVVGSLIFIFKVSSILLMALINRGLIFIAAVIYYSNFTVSHRFFLRSILYYCATL